ncbi:MAG: DUF192 domain-containing protein [Gammaproteobacteria bacterium]
MIRTHGFRGLLAGIAFVLLPFIAVTGCQAQSGALIALDAFPKSQLEIQSGPHKHSFDIWLAQTPEQQEQGLMFVRDLPENRGMLFPASAPRVFPMWMKNTYIALDMVFIAADGHIAKIAERTTPHSEAVISSDVPVAAILELRGGESARRALHVGDRVTWHTAP